MNQIVLIGVLCGLLLATAFVAGCTSNAPQTSTPTATTTPVSPTVVATSSLTSNPATTTPATGSTPANVTTTNTPAPTYTPSESNVVAFTAASLKGVSSKLASDFEKMYPGHHVVFNLDGTQALKTQVQNGAYADVFISASNTYTNELKSGGYFVNETVKPLTTNYVIVILPATNPGNIKSLVDLANPGVKIALAAKDVPVGTATMAALGNLANSTYGQDWKNATMKNVVTYETSEPGVATKVALGEVDAGFVYESTGTAAAKDTYVVITIPKKDNYLQTYTIGVLKETTSSGAAFDFEDFMLSSIGQQDLKDYGFRPVSTTS